MKNDYKFAFEMRNNRVLLRLAVVLTILLVLAIGAFVFLALNAKYNYVCLFECQKRESIVAKGRGSSPTEGASIAAVITADLQTYSLKTSKNEKTTPQSKMYTDISRKTTTLFTIDQLMTIRSRTPSTAIPAVVDRKTTNTVKTKSNLKKYTSPVITPVNLQTTRKPRWNLNKEYVKLRGNISFIGKAPKRLPRKSRLTVKFTEDLRADAPSILLGKTAVDLSSYHRGKPLSYTITCKRPKFAHEFYSVSAVLNVGWKPKRNKNQWIRRGDYFTDTYLDVHISKYKRLYVRNIQLVKYN